MLQTPKRFWGKRPGFDTGDLIHILVNVGFVLALFFMVRSWNLALLAGVLVILSKWRVFAVQSRFWLPNIKANLIDTVVGLSTVSLMQQADSRYLAIFWALLFLIWLLFVKPKTTDMYVGAQALWAQFIGYVSIFSTSLLLEYSFVALLLVWVIAWSAVRHFLANYEEPHYKTISLVWAFLISQLAWVGLHWINYYQIFSVNISNVALVTTVIAATIGALYHSYRMEKYSKSILFENLIVGGVLLALILLTSPWTSRL